MRIFKAPDGQSHGFMVDGTQDDLIEKAVSSGWAELASDAVQALLPPNLQPPTQPTQAQLQQLAANTVMDMLDTLARSWQYSSYLSARAYKGDISPKYNAEGTALANYGSACFSVLDDIAAGKIAQPATEEALLALMPAKPERPVVP